MLLRSILFVTVHKGASTFIADELARSLVKTNHFNNFMAVGSMRIKGKEISSMTDWPNEGLVGVRTYPAEFRDLLEAVPAFKDFVDNAAIIYLQRDPRDAAVSLFYSKAYSHTTNVRNKERFLNDRERLQNMSVRDGVQELTGRGAIGEFSKLHDLHSEFPGLMTRYEDLVTAPREWFESVGNFAGWPAELTSELQSKFEDSFAPPEAADPLKHKRRITPGNWTDVFDDELIAFFDDKMGDRLRANGYN